MVLKIFKGVWFFFLLATLGIFLYVYAALPENISFLKTGPAVPALFITRNGLFYSTLALLAMLNALVFLVSKVFGRRNEYFTAWVYGLVTLFNLFLIVALEFVSVYNSQERFNYESIGYIIYGSVALVVIWSALWPLYRLFQRFSDKQAV
jgi:hypothetical protein